MTLYFRCQSINNNNGNGVSVRFTPEPDPSVVSSAVPANPNLMMTTYPGNLEVIIQDITKPIPYIPGMLYPVNIFETPYTTPSPVPATSTVTSTAPQTMATPPKDQA